MFGIETIRAINADAALARDVTTITDLADARQTISDLQDAMYGHDEECVSGGLYADAEAANSELRSEIARLTRRIETLEGDDLAVRYEMADVRAWSEDRTF